MTLICYVLFINAIISWFFLEFVLEIYSLNSVKADCYIFGDALEIKKLSVNKTLNSNVKKNIIFTKKVLKNGICTPQKWCFKKTITVSFFKKIKEFQLKNIFNT